MPPSKTPVHPPPSGHLPTGGGFGPTGPTAHVQGDAIDPEPGETTLDDALRETFPASDPISPGASASGQAFEATPVAAAPVRPPGAVRKTSTAPFAFPTGASVAALQKPTAAGRRSPAGTASPARRRQG